jgi:Transglutaminase-like superfamily
VRRLSSFLRLTPTDRRLLIQSVLWVASIRLGLSLLPFRLLRQLLARVAQRATPPSDGDPASIPKVAWAVRTASRYVPAATCLTQALAAQVLLERRGLPARLHIGIAKDPSGKLLAHAWLESGGRIVVGGRGRRRYTPLLVLEGENR